jgi:GTP-binding protein 1
VINRTPLILQILGFSTSEQPVLPTSQATGASTEANPIAIGRREKLGWEEIAENSAKMISFIGMCSLMGYSSVRHCS